MIILVTLALVVLGAPLLALIIDVLDDRRYGPERGEQ